MGRKAKATSAEYGMSIRCHYVNDGVNRFNQHYQRMPLEDIPRWIEAYRFTHPLCTAITCKVWFNGLEEGGEGNDLVR